jgi:NADH-quinone oxidoreductase subunit L
VPRVPALQTLFERKFYVDELYDALFYRPAVFTALMLTGWIERPLVFGSVRELSQGVRGLGLETRRLQTGLVRTYALAIAASLAVVTVVFVTVR